MSAGQEPFLEDRSSEAGGDVLGNFATELGHGVRGCFLGCGPWVTLLPVFVFLLRVVDMEVLPAFLITLVICFLVIPAALRTELWIIAAIAILALLFYGFTQFVVNWQEVLFGWLSGGNSGSGEEIFRQPPPTPAP